MSDRLRYINALKVLFVLCVLFQHLSEYLGSDPLTRLGLTVLSTQLGGIGVSGFVILSGFGLTYSQLAKGSEVKLAPFFVRRFFRIIPLYYAALFAWLWVVALIPPMSLVAHLLLIHVFFPDFSHNPGALWYVGLVVQCYLAFPLAYRLFHQKQTVALWIFAVLLYSVGIALSYWGFYVIDSALFYAIEFLVGMDLARRLQSRKSELYLGARAAISGLIGFSIFASLAQFLQLSNLPVWLRYPAITLGRIAFLLIFLNLFYSLDRYWGKWASILSAASVASYSVYLFHRPIWTIAVKSPIWGWLIRLGSPLAEYMQFVYLVVFCIPLIFIIGYWIQVAYESMASYFQRSYI